MYDDDGIKDDYRVDWVPSFLILTAKKRKNLMEITMKQYHHLIFITYRSPAVRSLGLKKSDGNKSINILKELYMLHSTRIASQRQILKGNKYGLSSPRFDNQFDFFCKKKGGGERSVFLVNLDKNIINKCETLDHFFVERGYIYNDVRRGYKWRKSNLTSSQLLCVEGGKKLMKLRFYQ